MRGGFESSCNPLSQPLPLAGERSMSWWAGLVGRKSAEPLLRVLAQLGFADLARLSHREGVDEHHVARQLEARDLAAAVTQHLLRLDHRTLSALDIGHGDLAQALV